MSQAIGRGGVGNIRSSSRARATSHAPEGATQTASIINEINESNAEYERIVIQTSEDAAKNVVSHRTPLCLIFIFICLLIFNRSNTLASLVPLATIIVGFSFIFGHSAQTLFESVSIYYIADLRAKG